MSTKTAAKGIRWEMCAKPPNGPDFSRRENPQHWGNLMNLDERRFRDALGAFPTGVAIVTGKTPEGERLGMTVSSFNSVSIAPPLVLFSIARRARSFITWCLLQRYIINILSQEQEQLSNRFARSLDDKWLGVIVAEGDSGLPFFPNSLAAFECEPYARYNGGDHEIFVGRVIALRTNARKQEQPLIFWGGRYRRIDTGFQDALPQNVSIFEGW